jgi:CheY-like chemotaxis protein
MSKHRILIVDDTPANIKILADLLRKDYLLSVATSGPEALQIAASDDRPDLVLLDVMMPEMDGYEVCRRLRADLRTQHVPIIFVTAMSEVDDETRGFSLGAVDYITKPIRPPIVRARVAAHLELARAR